MTKMKDYTEETHHCSWWGGAGEALPVEKVKQLQNERDQLAARIQRLEKVVFDAYNPYGFDMAMMPKLKEALNESPSQSLLVHDAGVIRKERDRLRAYAGGPEGHIPKSQMYLLDRMEEEADRMETEAGNE